MTEATATLSDLAIYPVKSCAGIACAQALLDDTGLEWDRQWMVVDRHGQMLTQRELPRMALVAPSWRGGDLVLRAPGMLALHLHLDVVETPCRVQVWDDAVHAFEMGALAAQWFSDFLGHSLRLVRFDPEQRRLADARWTGTLQAETAFADGFPLLVASTASLADLNRRLAARGAAPVEMRRFRPNLVLDGLDAWDEDHLGELEITTDGGPLRLRLVKPCTRCSIPNIDPADAGTGHEPGDTLATFRADARVGGGVTFGMNAVIVAGAGQTLRVGQPVRASWAL